MFREMARELIVGAYDLHTHTTPSAFPRALNDLELVREADEKMLESKLAYYAEHDRRVRK